MKTPTVRVRRESVTFPTYMPDAPNRNPMFLEKRVYQGSSGKVYPLPFIDRVSEIRSDVKWDAVHLENEFLYAMILPQIGGRIHVLRDKTNGYDLVYNQPVIKPALVGLAGPWASGGIEFNWPQHHRPSTFMPANVEIEHGEDGSITVWLSEHDPMARMKGMHGVCLHPGRAVLEVKVRAYNRTPFVQTFLWWANVATRVHEEYQSFFPPDVSSIADHAKRAMSEYPLCQGQYYGVDYGSRGREGVPAEERPQQNIPTDPPAYAPNDLSWYANIPVPTSYMCMGTREDFFGGYDHKIRAGLVHVADHRIAPGKKQWTWGNHEFGYAWDRNLTDANSKGEFAPYIELMAGVFTDNQPDFSFLQPGETKCWSQYWYPIREIGPAQHANLDAAVSQRIVDLHVRMGVSVTRLFAGARVTLECDGRRRYDRRADLSPAAPLVGELKLLAKEKRRKWRLRITDANGREIISYTPASPTRARPADAATEPPAPTEVATAEELFLTGLHLDQYRHATRLPEPYWREALRRDPGDSRSNNALGLWHLKRGEFENAEPFLRRAIERLTRRNPNPYDGEPYYNLGLCLRFLERDDESAEAFAKAAWNHTWKGAAWHAVAESDCRRQDWASAIEHLDASLGVESGNLRARALKVVVLRRLGRMDAAARLLRETLALDPLDWWSKYLMGEELACDDQVRLDVAHDYARAGLWEDAVQLLVSVGKVIGRGTAPLVAYTLAWVLEKAGNSGRARAARKRAQAASPDYCFPARLEEIAVLECAISLNANDARAPYYLGNLLYDRRRHEEAIVQWERAAKLDPKFSVVWRNLGIGYFNVRKQPRKAREAYEKAFHADPEDARVLYERDQLWKRLGEPPAKRLRELLRHPRLVARRDDLAVELCAVFNQTGRPENVLSILSNRTFQPWEGGEGQVLGQHVRAHVALGRKALAAGNATGALDHFRGALHVPKNLGETRHLLANASDIWFWLGEACWSLGDEVEAKRWWRKAAEFRGDFQEMSVRPFSEMTFFSILSLNRLKRSAEARRLATDLLAHAKLLARTPAKIDYFATSLPTLLLFDEDIQARQELTARFLQAQASFCLGNKAQAARITHEVLAADPAHGPAADLHSLLTNQT